jgi:hypothetical protein
MEVNLYQWLIGYSLGGTSTFKLTHYRYPDEISVREYEIVGPTSVVYPLMESLLVLPIAEYESLGYKYPNDPEYSREIRHHGGLDGYIS